MVMQTELCLVTNDKARIENVYLQCHCHSAMSLSLTAMRSKNNMIHGLPQEVEYQVDIRTKVLFSPAVVWQWTLLILEYPCWWADQEELPSIFQAKKLQAFPRGSESRILL